MKKQFLSLLLALLMVFTLLPVQVWATEGEGITSAQESQEEVVDPVSQLPKLTVSEDEEIVPPEGETPQAPQPEDEPTQDTPPVEETENSQAVDLLDAANATVVGSGKCGSNAKWLLTSDGILTVSGTGNMRDYTFDYENNKPTSPWGSAKSRITKIVITSGITAIGEFSFASCDNLTSISIPQSVKSIGAYAFSWCTGLKSLDLPEGIVSIGYYAFEFCEELVHISLPDSLTTLEHGSLWGCSSLEEITIPSNVNENVGSYIFAGCSALKTIIVAPENCTYSAQNGILFSKDESKLIYVPLNHDSTFKIPPSVTTIAEYAFRDNPNLTDFVISDNVTTIEGGAFCSCSNLSSITLSDSIMEIGFGAFSDCNTLEDIYYAGTRRQWNKISIDEDNASLFSAKIHFIEINGDLNGSGGSPDSCDVQCLYKFLISNTIEGKYQNMRNVFLDIADLNRDGNVDVYDLQLLYEVVGGIGSIKDLPVGDNKQYKVAMITDCGDIFDQSYNQVTYEACKEYCSTNNLEFRYFKPVDDSTADRTTMIERAIGEGYNIIVMSGFMFADSIVQTAPKYPDIKFVALDITKSDYLAAAMFALGRDDYDYQPDNWDLEEYVDLSNVYTMTYREELCGYIAGYATVKMGYTKLGYIGGMAVPEIKRYGYGYVQGVNDAAKETGTTVEMKYIYAGLFFSDISITTEMDEWYASGTQAVFVCGGSIYISVAEAAQKFNGKVIGADVDQASIINLFANEDTTITSAIKGLASSTKAALKDIIEDGRWDELAGKIDSLGLISATVLDANYVGIPTGDGTAWCDTFTTDDYAALVADMIDGKINVSNNTSKVPSDFATNITLTDLGALN